MSKKNINELVVILFKFVVFVLLLFTFLVVMQRVNYAVTEKTRTAFVTSSAFVLTLMLMQNIYGNFEIGEKKSKPVFLSTMISVLIADVVAAMAMVVMGIIQFSVSSILLSLLFHLMVTYILQGLLVWVAAHVGNDIYFKLYKPANTIIYYNDDKVFEKISKFVESHDKQYKVIMSEKCFKMDGVQYGEIDTIFALGIDSESLSKLMYYCYKFNIRLIYDADFMSVISGSTNTLVIDDVLLVETRPASISIIQSFIKRCIDIVGASILLIVTLPITLLVSIAIKLDDNGPVFYRQTRITKEEKEFEIIKFRSMKLNSGDRPAEVNDDRITKVGHIIRKYRVDEIPQALNILKGDISLVGPRPESKAHAEEISKTVPDFNMRLKVKGGLTGYAQIFGKYNTTPEQKLLLDLKYIESFSIIEDLKLIFQTLMVFIRPDSTEAFEEKDSIYGK